MKRHRTLLNTSVLTISVVLVRSTLTNPKVWDQQWFQKFLKPLNVKSKHWLRWICRRFSVSFGKRHIERNKSPIYTQCGWKSFVVSNIATYIDASFSYQGCDIPDPQSLTPIIRTKLMVFDYLMLRKQKKKKNAAVSEVDTIALIISLFVELLR